MRVVDSVDDGGVFIPPYLSVYTRSDRKEIVEVCSGVVLGSFGVDAECIDKGVTADAQHIEIDGVVYVYVFGDTLLMGNFFKDFVKCKETA